MKLSILALTMLATATAEPLSAADETRARLARPPKGSPVLATSTDPVALTINKWMEEAYPAANIKTCDSFTNEELNDILSTLVGNANPALQEIYAESCDQPNGCDKRSLRYATVADFESEFKNELAVIGVQSDGKTKDSLVELLHNSKCHEAALIFHHHLSEDARATYMEKLSIPLLPTDRQAYDHLKQVVRNADNASATQVIQDELDKFIITAACAGCHRAIFSEWDDLVQVA